MEPPIRDDSRQPQKFGENVRHVPYNAVLLSNRKQTTRSQQAKAEFVFPRSFRVTFTKSDIEVVVKEAQEAILLVKDIFAKICYNKT